MSAHSLRPAPALAAVMLAIGISVSGAQRPGQPGAMGHQMGMRHDSATMAQMSVMHELVMNHDKVTRQVTNLKNGVRTVTESSDPRLARLIKDHVATMAARVEQRDDPGLPMETPAVRILFRNGAKITTHADTTANGVILVQTSTDSETVAALQQHAADVSDLVREGMPAMHRAMMGSGGGMMQGRMMHDSAMAGGMMHGQMMQGTGDSAFKAMQARGADRRAMGVDQNTSMHQFDALPDGGRIELVRTVDDSAGVAQIRKHLREIAAAFKKGDFSIPAFVHQQSVPGTAVMAKKRDVITYTERDLPRGGEVRITTKDPEAIAAIHEFMAFQRHDHHAGGMGAMKMPERR